jgi:hypothetical protein
MSAGHRLIKRARKQPFGDRRALPLHITVRAGAPSRRAGANVTQGGRA